MMWLITTAEAASTLSFDNPSIPAQLLCSKVRFSWSGGVPVYKLQITDATTDAAYGILAAIQVGRLKDEGSAAPEMISMIKRQNCDRALINTRALQEIFGGNAVSDEYHIGRHVANLFVTQTYEGQSDIHCEYR